MTPLKYLTASKVGTTTEILALKREDPKGFYTILEFAKEEMKNNNIPIEEPSVS